MKQPKSRHASKHRVTEEKARSRQYCVKQRVVAHKCISVVVKGPAIQVNSTTVQHQPWKQTAAEDYDWQLRKC